jgi:hypothetical protein
MKQAERSLRRKPNLRLKNQIQSTPGLRPALFENKRSRRSGLPQRPTAAGEGTLK